MRPLPFLTLLFLFGVVAPVRTAVGQEENKRLNPIHALAWSPDGSKLAVGIGWDVCAGEYATTYGLHILDGQSGKFIRMLIDSTCPTWEFDWNSESNKIASATIKNANGGVWDVTTGLPVMKGEAITLGWTTVKWEPHGSKLAFIDLGGGVYILDGVTGQLLDAPYLAGADIAWSPDGKSLATTGLVRDDNWLHVYNFQTKMILYEVSGGGDFVVWSPDGTKILTGTNDYGIRTWNATTGTALMTLSGHTSIINNAVWHPDSRHVASASDDGTVRVWDADSGKEIYRIDVGSRVYAVAWSPDGKQFAYGGIEGVVHIIPSPLTETTAEATPPP